MFRSSNFLELRGRSARTIVVDLWSRAALRISFAHAGMATSFDRLGEQAATSKWSMRMLLVLFFLSGFAALLYQVIWQRMLVFYTGSDTVSISLIVTAFMSGLGLGYLMGGKLADHRSPKRNLLLFVLAEVGILLFAVGSKAILYDWLYLNGPRTGNNTVLLYLVVVGVLVVPTFLMGISLPLLARAYHLGSLDDQARYIGKLYFVNTLGAAVGALVTGVLLVRTLGYHDALWVGVFCNGVCAFGAWWLGKRIPAQKVQTTADRPTGKHAKRGSRTLVTWSMQYALSGFAALSLELIWFRVLEALIKSVSLTFSILLAIYLGCMAFGTIAGTRWTRFAGTQARERLFLRAQLTLYVYTGASFLLFLGLIHEWDVLRFLWDYFQSYEPNFTMRIAVPVYVLIPLFLMAVPTFLMGVSFAVSQSLIQDRWEEVGRRLGWLQFVNIVGSAAGAWLVTWVGFNILGTAVLLKVLTAIGLIYVVVLLIRGHARLGRAAILTLVVLTVVVALPGDFDFWRTLNGMAEEDRFIHQENESGLSIIKRLEHHGSMAGIVFANGLGQSSMPYRKDPIHSQLGAMGVLLHPAPRSIAVIGLGSAGTLHGMACRAETKEIVCFEIMSNQPDVLRTYATRFEDRAVLEALDDPRLRLITHDGRYQLTTMTDLYDVIEADALRPSSAFSGNIYSKEYFQLLRSRLKPSGLAVTWCPTPRVFNTFREVFPHIASVEGFLLIGSDSPISLDWAAIRQRMHDPYTLDHFARAGISVDSLVGPLESKLVLLELSASTKKEINTDLFPKDEYTLPYDEALVNRKIRAFLDRW